MKWTSLAGGAVLRRLMTIVAGLALALGAAAHEARQLRIVKQPGLGYLQLIVMREHEARREAAAR